jgi:hypothetical protein
VCENEFRQKKFKCTFGELHEALSLDFSDKHLSRLHIKEKENDVLIVDYEANQNPDMTRSPRMNP